MAHECIKVDQIEGAKISVIDEKSQKIVIDMSLKENQHLDYSYTSTIHGLEGATAKNIMVLLDAMNTKSNTRRLMYVATTRATHNATIYTNNIETVKWQVCLNWGGKTSALESMGLLK